MLRYALLCSIAAVAAAQPSIVNAKLETRSAASGLQAAFRGIVDHTGGPAWIGYSVPAIDNSERGCNGDGRCFLEDEHIRNVQRRAPVKLEGSGRMAVLIRVEAKQTQQVRVYSDTCTLDAGGLAVYWLTDVRPNESVELMTGLVRAGEGRVRDGAMLAIALQEGEPAGRVLERLASAPEPDAVREKAIFWLGAVRGKQGCDMLRRIVRDDPSDALREKAIFALSINKTPEAVEALIDTARRDKSAHVRGQALFWLADKAGRKSQAAITDAIANDPDTHVKKQAVFALSRLPHDEGVPLLIQTARTNRNPEVRKQALFWLGQSGDPRALDFIEKLIKE